MIQRHKTITLFPGHPTDGGMNTYKTFPNGSRRVLSNNNRFTPIVTGADRNTWEPIYGISTDCSNKTKNAVPGVFGETFNVPDVPTQIITNGVVELPTDKYLAAPSDKRTWKPGEILVLTPKGTSGWAIGIIDPVGTSTVAEYTHLQIGVLLTPIDWDLVSGTSQYAPVQPTANVLVGYNKIPKPMVKGSAVKAAPLATPKVAAK